MKKISIILSTVVAASLLALASCSNVTELNGNQYTTYNDPTYTLAGAESKARNVTVSTGSTSLDVMFKADYEALPEKITAYYKGATTILPAKTTVQLSAGSSVIYEAELAEGTVLTANWSSIELKRKAIGETEKAAIKAAIGTGTTLSLSSNL